MSQENVELAYRAADAINRRDLDAFLALCDPDGEYFSHLVELEGGGPYTAMTVPAAGGRSLRRLPRLQHPSRGRT